MKRFISIISALLISVNVAGCGTSTSGSYKTATPTKVPATPSPTATPTNKPTLAYNVSKVKSFCNGIAWVTAHNKEISEYKNIAVNADGKVVFTTTKPSDEYLKYIVHPEKGLVATPDTHGYTDILAGGGGYYIVLKKEEGFDSVTCKVGCIASDGTVVMPPTFLPNGSGSAAAKYLGEGCFAILLGYGSLQNPAASSFLYNAATNSWSSDYSDLRDLHTPNEMIYNPYKCAFVNSQGNIIADLSAYKDKIKSVSSAEGYGLLNLAGTDQRRYYCVFNSNGTEVIPPTAYSGIGSQGTSVTSINNGHFMAIDWNNLKSVSVNGSVRVDTELDLSYTLTNTLSDGWLTLKYDGDEINFVNLDGELMFPNEIIRLEAE